MPDYILSCCSTADVRKEDFERRNIRYICFHYYLNGKHYPDDLGESMPFAEFYQAMADGAETKTSQINVSEYLDYFEGFLREGKDILHISLSSGLSGSFSAATAASLIAMERFPGRKVRVVDSLGASSGYGLLMDSVAEKYAAGMELDALADWAEANRLNVHHWFFSTDLSSYVRGGRISRAAGFFGGIVGICPLLNMDEPGHLIPRARIRGKKRVIEALVQRMEQYAQDGADYSGKCYISHSACLEDAQTVAEMVTARFPKLCGQVEIYDIGTTIGSHTGPGTVALFFWGETRKGK